MSLKVVTHKKSRPYEVILDVIKKRIEAKVWSVGEMIPGRRRLATEFGVSLSAVERAIASLIANGFLRADDRRGTFVADIDSNIATFDSSPISERGSLVASVGIVASVIQYNSSAKAAEQWSTQVLSACEHQLSSEPGICQSFVNLTPKLNDLTPEEVVKQLVKDSVDAVIVIFNSDIIPTLRAAGLNVFCINPSSVNATVASVSIDYMMGGVLAGRHMRERGYDRLVFLRPYEADWIDGRLRGAQAEVGVDNIEKLPTGAVGVMPSIDDGCMFDAGQNSCKQLLKSGINPKTGIIAPNDITAIGFMDEAKKNGLEAGSDYGIIGFDDREREAQLTSLRPPLEQLGVEMANNLITTLRGEPAPTHIDLPPRLIARGSTRAAENLM